MEERYYDEVENEEETSEDFEITVNDEAEEAEHIDTLKKQEGAELLEAYDVDIDNITDKPWCKPGADITDYFNYGFNETTWRQYCGKQKKLREDYKDKGGREGGRERERDGGRERERERERFGERERERERRDGGRERERERERFGDRERERGGRERERERGGRDRERERERDRKEWRGRRW